MTFLLQLGGSIVAILLLAWLAARLKLGGEPRIRDEDHARELAEHIACDFRPVAVAVDREGGGALLRDAEGRHLVLRRHGTSFVGRMLDVRGETTFESNLLTVNTGERRFGTITLDLGDDAPRWAAGLQRA